jgi:hypothetical protein
VKRWEALRVLHGRLRFGNASTLAETPVGARILRATAARYDGTPYAFIVL